MAAFFFLLVGGEFSEPSLPARLDKDLDGSAISTDVQAECNLF